MLIQMHGVEVRILVGVVLIAWAAFTMPAVGADSKGVLIDDAQVTLIGEVRLPAREAGVLTAMPAKEGDVVQPGAVLAEVEADLSRLQAKAARSDFDVAAAHAENDVDVRFALKSIDVAEAELRRATESVRAAPKSISKTELERLALVVERAKLTAEQARRDLDVARLTAQAKKAQWDAAEKHVERCEINAPWKGMVVQILRRPGEWVNPGDPVIRLIQIDRLRVEAFLDGALYGSTLAGSVVKLTVPSIGGETHEYSGKVAFVSPEVQPVTRKVRIWAEVDNPLLTLRPGERGTLFITASTTKKSVP